MVKISIIIPVYNSEKFLSQCLDSIIGQSLKEIEIICVNDGSIDNSLNILEDYANNDKRIVIIDKENEGTGKARNIAIKQASGEYLYFVDSDDWIEEKTCENLYSISKKYNLDLLQTISFNLIKESTERIEMTDFIEKHEYNIISGKEFSANNYTRSYAWGKLWNSQFLKKNNLSFSEHYIGEDIIITFRGFLYAQRVLTIDYKCYNYRIHSSSMMRQKRGVKFIDSYHKIAIEMLDTINEFDLWDNFGFMKRLIINLYRINLYNTKENGLDNDLIEFNKSFVKRTRSEFKKKRGKGIRFTSHIERFYILPTFFWRFFKRI